jgi:hypothetical protein
MESRNATTEREAREARISAILLSAKEAVLKDARLVLEREVSEAKDERKTRSLSNLLFTALALKSVAEITKKGTLGKNPHTTVESRDGVLIINAKILSNTTEPATNLRIEMAKGKMTLLLTTSPDKDEKPLLFLQLREETFKRDSYKIEKGEIVHKNVDPWYMATESRHERSRQNFSQYIEDVKQKALLNPIAKFIASKL